MYQCTIVDHSSDPHPAHRMEKRSRESQPPLKFRNRCVEPTQFDKQRVLQDSC